MKNSMFRKVICLFLALAMLVGVLPAVFAAEEKAVVAPSGLYVISQTDYVITAGVTETQVLLNDASGEQQVAGFMTTVAPGAKVTFKASYTGYYTEGSTVGSRAEAAENLTWGMARTTDQAKAYEAATGDKVIFATNGDYYNMQTLQPLGYLIMEGNVVQTGNGNAQEPYFAVLRDGSYAIRDYGTDHSDVLEAISGPFYLVKDGVNVADPNNKDQMPRNSIGMKADGSVVTFLADGRQAPYSVGMSLYDQAELLLQNGCVDALYLDGGGSATYATVREGTEEMVVRNSPSDGPERTVASALLMVSTAISDGSFDHASLYPKNEVYTPGSTVQFTAIGVDAAGEPAEIPEGLTWSVAAECGDITSDGVFTAKEGYAGEVEVSLMKGASNYGTTKITIADIDDLYFTGESISLDFDADSNLGLNAKYLKRIIHYKDGDFTWEIKSTTEGVEDAAVGTMNGNIFHSGKFEGTVTADVTVTYTKLDGSTLSDVIHVEIGKMPVIYQDFEPDENGPLTAAHYHWGKNTYHYEGSPYGDGYYGEYPTLDVITAGTYSGSPTVTTLTAPYQFTGNYDSAVPAAPIFRANGYTYYLWPNNSIKAYNAGALRTVSREEGGQVRSGDYALELNYDYSSFDNSSNSNFYVRYCGEEIPVEGYPTQVGVWVYAPEGTPAYKVYVDIAVWNGNGYSTKNIPLLNASEGEQSGGINWTGWMYCYADLTALHASITPEHPLMIRQGEGLVWLSYQPAAGEGRFNGTLYFDDMCFVYGTNLDDLVNPVIDTLTVNGMELAADGSTVITEADVEIEAAFHDPESQNRTGVDAAATTIFIDGKNIACDGDDAKAMTRTSLGNGHHTVTVTISDGDGNTVSMTREFDVAVEGAENAYVTFGGDGIVTLGGVYVMDLTVEGTVSEIEMTVVDINTDFGTPTTGAGGSVYGAPVITFAEGVTGEYEFLSTGYKKGALTLKVSAEAGLTGTVATVSFDIPTTVDPEVDYLKYRVSNISFTDMNGAVGTDAYGYTVLPVVAYYDVAIGTMVYGRDCTITVYDIDGLPAANVTVKLNGTEIGATAEDGTLTTNAMAAMEVGTEFVITAESELGLSFESKAKVLGYAGNEDNLPNAVRHNIVEDDSTMTSISWFTNANYAREKAYIRYMTEEQYEKLTKGFGPDTNYLTVRGETAMVPFATTGNAAYLHTVTLDGLTPETTYYYWLGDGSEEAWSEAMTFTTEAADDETSVFYILGDTQMTGDPAQDADAINEINAILALIAEYDVDFGIQTGDFIDNGDNYNHYAQILNILQNSSVGDKLLYSAFGNHEYYGASAGAIAEQIFAIPHPNYYSVEHGDVYLAVINYGSDLEEVAAWIQEDAAASECTWKLVTVHEPIYFTNESAGNLRYQEILAPAFEAAGIDVVLNGHDHSYARTEQLKGGMVVEDGTTYFICGDLGEKSRDVNYIAVDNPEFHFAIVTQDYDSVYLMAEATEKKLTITAYNSDGTQLDSFTKEIPEEIIDPDDPDDPDDPVIEHEYVYDRANDTLICVTEECEEPAPEDYTGWATDLETGKKMYFIGGDYVTEWLTIGSDLYHFDLETGLMHELTILEDVPTTCDTQGHKTVECECGETKTIEYSKPTGHDNEEKVAEDGTVTYVCVNCGRESIYDLSFIDVPDDAWFAPYIDYVVKAGLFGGRTSMIFDPNTAMSRVELVSVIWRAAGQPEFDNIHTVPFTDCATNAWYTAAVNWASKNEIVNGIGDGLFDPQGQITREQIVTILYRYAKFVGMDTTKTTDISENFTDAESVSLYAREAMAWAVAEGIIVGDDGEILPLNNATRAEVATMMTRFHKLQLAQEETPEEPEDPENPEDPTDPENPGGPDLVIDPVN